MVVYNTSGKKGLSDQEKVETYLRDSLGWKIKNPTRDQDLNQDIDIWATVGESREYSPVSIKCPHQGLKYGHIGFETDVQVIDPETHQPMWLGSSWFQKGRAKYYVIYQGDNLYIMLKREILDAWRSGKIKPERVATLNEATKRKQAEMKHPHVDTKCVYFSRQKLLDLCILHHLGVIPNGRPKPRPFKIIVSEIEYK